METLYIQNDGIQQNMVLLHQNFDCSYYDSIGKQIVSLHSM